MRSSHSRGDKRNCVQISFVDGMVALRGSRVPGQRPLVFTPGEYDAFVAGVVAGELRRPR
ncbi:DUF397 domain-containing protein [Allostreptomyces psammosilenae]|uniref:DUF397 domain-containing protein n=1 Tax=Allostreptomyces psammosilenae TaxID=1892865 RepID=A0A853A0S9_9ACTN|nr:hypothetical protein [Allostreptomyces psammosilenae]